MGSISSSSPSQVKDDEVQISSLGYIPIKFLISRAVVRNPNIYQIGKDNVASHKSSISSSKLQRLQFKNINESQNNDNGVE